MTLPSMDQRRQAKNGRCRHCQRHLDRAADKRRTQRAERNAEQTAIEMHGVQTASHLLSIDGKM